MASACTPSSSAPTAVDEGVQVRPAALSVATSAVKANVSRPLRELRPAPGIMAAATRRRFRSVFRIPHPRPERAAPLSPIPSDRQRCQPSRRSRPRPARPSRASGKGSLARTEHFRLTWRRPTPTAPSVRITYVQIVNIALAVFNRTGDPLLGPIPINELWRDFGGLCENFNSGDPTVNYDRFRGPLGDRQFALISRRPLRPVRGGVYHRAIRRVPTAATPSVPRHLPRLPEARRLAGRLLHHLQHFQRGNAFVGPTICAVTARRCWPVSPPRSSASTRAPALRASWPPI